MGNSRPQLSIPRTHQAKHNPNKPIYRVKEWALPSPLQLRCNRTQWERTASSLNNSNNNQCSQICFLNNSRILKIGSLHRKAFRVIKVAYQSIDRSLQTNLPKNSVYVILERPAMVVITLCTPFSVKIIKAGMKYKDDIKNSSCWDKLSTRDFLASTCLQSLRNVKW